MQTDLYIESVAEQFCGCSLKEFQKIEDGAINETFEVTCECHDEPFILQHMSSIFSTAVMHNLEAVSERLELAGVPVPLPIRTIDGALYLPSKQDRWWRALTYMPGETINDTITPARAASAGRLIGTFHTALADFSGNLSQPLPYFHDTTHTVSRLQAVAAHEHRDERRRVLLPLIERALTHYEQINPALQQLPQRVIHADLKVNNIRFVDDEALALIDMDTMMEHTIAVELGDALRSWCGIHGEDSATQVFDTTIANEALAGYFATATFLSAAERAAILDGVHLITVELAMRFLTDAMEERYFRLQPAYSSLYQQNKTKGENQLKLLDDFLAKRELIVV